MLINPVVLCPHCHVPAGSPCKNKHGEDMKLGVYHVERVVLFLERPR